MVAPSLPRVCLSLATYTYSACMCTLASYSAAGLGRKSISDVRILEVSTCRRRTLLSNPVRN